MNNVVNIVLAGVAILILIGIVSMASVIFDSYGRAPAVYQEVATVESFLDEYSGAVISGRDARGISNVIGKYGAKVEIRVRSPDNAETGNIDDVKNYREYLVQLEHDSGGATRTVIFSEMGGGLLIECHTDNYDSGFFTADCNSNCDGREPYESRDVAWQ